VNTAQGVIFAQLVFVFTVNFLETVYPIALIQGFARAKSSAAIIKKDIDLHFLHLRKLKDIHTEFVFARSIIHGAILLPAGDREGDYIVFDLVDTDMCMRIQELHSVRVMITCHGTYIDLGFPPEVLSF
jgi:hypothetical protein